MPSSASSVSHLIEFAPFQLDLPYPTCTINPCTTIPGLTASGFYWTRTNLDPGYAFGVSFGNGIYGNANKGASLLVRAVRGGA